MAPSVDSAIVKALGLDPSTASMSTHGGSGFSSTFKISGVSHGQPVSYFVKTGTGAAAETMFRGEHHSLNAIHDTVPNFCPKSYAHGPMSTSGKFFLATDFLELGSTATGGSGLSFAAKLAKLHTTPAPAPDGFDRPMFGFPVPTCCGETPQENSWRESWADFYADNRLRAILRAAVRKNGSDAELSDAVDKVASRVVPRLIGDERLGKSVFPVVCHGDLWSGNHSRGRIGNGDGNEEVVFDPSAVYGHSEYDLGIMKMFGGAGRNFWAEYEKLVPKAEPVSEWEDRVLLYELYHHLNHFAMFGGAYREGAMSIMRRLISKYGS